HFGFDGRRTLSTVGGFGASNGSYGYSSFERFLRDLPPDVQSQRAFNASNFNGNNWSLFGYINDRFVAAPGVSIDLGLGYQYTTLPRSLRNQAFNNAASVPGVLEFIEPEAQQWNWNPKVGVAISPGILRGATIRGGFGITRDAIQNNFYFLPTAPQLGTVAYGDLGSASPGFLAGGGLAAPAGLGSSLTPAQARAQTTFYAADQRLPYSMQWNAGLQQEIWRGIVLEAKYLGARTLDIPVQTRLNSIAGVSVERSLPVYYLVPGFDTLDLLPVSYESIRLGQANPLAQYGFTSPITAFVNDGQSTYHALGLEARTRFAGGFQMLGSYTWSHLIDNVAYGTVQGTANRSGDRADSAFDRRQRAVISGLFEPAAMFPANMSFVRNVVANFAIGGTFTYQTPGRFTPLAGFDANFDGDGLSDRAIVNGNAAGSAGTGTTGLVNRSGQLVGYVANDPNARYVRTPSGAFASGSRNTLSLGQINNFDVFATKRFSYRERFGVEVRGDAYNIFNHAQYTTDPITDLYGTSPATMMSMLIPGTTNFNNFSNLLSSRPRVLQVALRVTF
ncbi:MAG TPA: hypothetical protein VEQ63_09335, partial [Bryobacteraceae bacterium]|nr:hypothetical protein [Bryobacteraceae bacterium]